MRPEACRPILLQVVALQQKPDLLNLGVFAESQARRLGAK
jgi:hypothetical protein